MLHTIERKKKNIYVKIFESVQICMEILFSNALETNQKRFALSL